MNDYTMILPLGLVRYTQTKLLLLRPYVINIVPLEKDEIDLIFAERVRLSRTSLGPFRSLISHRV